MEASGMVMKWSSRPKESRAVRVRENQRRHRAKTKAYIATLEKQLAEMRSRLDDALTNNAALKSEIESFRANCATTDLEDTYARSQPVSEQLSVSVGPDGLRGISTSPVSTSYTDEEHPSLMNPGQQDGARVSRTNSTPPFTATQQPSPSSGCVLIQEEETSALTLPTVPNDSCPNSCSLDGNDILNFTNQDDCLHLRPSAPGESTIPCKVAYSIIKQQNRGSFDLSVIRHFLAPGFRGATTQADGCRVESNRVFAVIDIISSPVASTLLDVSSM